jgi:tetratricopeptide (TPR) repeat protein
MRLNNGKHYTYSFLRSAFLLVTSILIFFQAMADERQTKFEEGNKLYQSRNFEGAIKKYEEALQAGAPLPEVYFNLGNAYYKTGNYPAAILNYERAKRLKPDDEDIQFNLRLANLNTVDKIDPVPQLFYERWWYNFINGSTASKWATRSFVLLWVAFVLGCIYLFSRSIGIRKISFSLAVVLLAGTFFFLYLAHEQDDFVKNNRSAVIMEPSAYIKSSPDDKSVNLFMLHAGTKIEIIDELQGWKKIRIANGNVGWIVNDAVQVI